MLPGHHSIAPSLTCEIHPGPRSNLNAKSSPLLIRKQSSALPAVTMTTVYCWVPSEQLRLTRAPDGFIAAGEPRSATSFPEVRLGIVSGLRVLVTFLLGVC